MRRSVITLVSLVSLIGGLAVSPAHAHFAIKRPRGLEKKSTRVQMFFWKHNYYHAMGEVKVARRVKSRLSTRELAFIDPIGSLTRGQRLDDTIRDHLWLAKTSEEHIQALEAKIQRATLPAHYALWRCIAGYPGARPGGGTGESGGSPSASNGTHFNILQMTNPWYGINPIGLAPSTIMQAAENAYAANHFSRGWLQGQWGQTISPCWQYA